MKQVLLLLSIGLAGHAEATRLENVFTGQLEDVPSRSAFIVFVQPHCGPCKMQMEAMKCISKKYGKGWNVMAVKMRGETEELKSGLRAMELPFPVVKGTSRFLAPFGAAEAPAPTTLVYNKAGKLVDRVEGARPCAFWEQVARK